MSRVWRLLFSRMVLATDICSHIGSASKSGRNSPSSTLWRAESQYPISVTAVLFTADVVTLWFKISDGKGGRPNRAISSDI